MPRRVRAQSFTDRVIGPAWSMVHDRPITPVRGTRPWVGLSPVMPQYAAGMRMEPPVSVPMATGIIPAATAAPDPDDDPPVVRVRSHGLWTRPNVLLAAPPQASWNGWN